jgi:hypothetical protein
MSEWWSYRPSDFALFSERVYHRLFELHNQAFWPSHMLAAALGVLILFLLAWRPARARRIVPAALGILWLWVSWTFFWRSYATINWAAVYVAPVAMLEGVLLLWLALRGSITFQLPTGLTRIGALILLAASVLLYPALAPAMGRPWQSAELFGIAPDPTALATLAALALAAGRARWAASVVPAVWSALSALTLWAIEADWPWLPVLGAALALCFGAGGGRAPRPLSRRSGRGELFPSD